MTKKKKKKNLKVLFFNKFIIRNYKFVDKYIIRNSKIALIKYAKINKVSTVF